jgi:hypothetical protein
MTAVFKSRQIDSRNRLWGCFKWQISMPVEVFLEVRDWCYVTWGPAVEYIWWEQYGVKRNNVNWSFDTSKYLGKKPRSTIYLRSDEELTLFHLKWQ